MRRHTGLVLNVALQIALLTGFVVADENAEYDAINLKTPFVNVMTGGQPSLEDINKLKERGYSTVINMRTPEEEVSFDEASLVQELGMEYFSLPVGGLDEINLSTARRLDELLNSGEKTFIHCASGNRVGAIFALRAFYLEGKTRDQALEIGDQAGLTRLRAQVEAMLSVENTGSSN